MRPYLDTILEDQGIEGVIMFLQNVGPEGIHLAKRETEVLADCLSQLIKQKQEKR